jgi:hypothetical protein
MSDYRPYPSAPRDPVPPPVIDHGPAIDPPAPEAEAEPLRVAAAETVRAAPPEPPPEPPRMAPSAPPPPPAPKRGGGSNLLSILLFLILGGGLYYVYANPKPQTDKSDALPALQRQVQAESQAAGQAATQLQGVAQQVQTLTDRVDKLEKATAALQAAPPPAPAPAAPPDLGDLPQRVSDLSNRVATLESQPVATGAGRAGGLNPQVVAALRQRLDQMQSAIGQLQSQQKDAADQTQAAIAQAQAQIQTQVKAALDQAQAADRDAIAQAQTQIQAQVKSAIDQAQAGDKDALDQVQTQQKDALAQLQAQATALAQTKTALDQLGGRVEKIEQGATSVEDAASRATRLERVQAAVVALQAGQKLGEIPNAPPALQKFATVAPPTEAALREAFPALAAHARAVSQPATADKSFLQRALARLQESVTVRQGNDVLVGDPAAGVLADAEVKVQNGDLAGAVHTLQALQGPAAAAMAGWMDQAQSLLAARAALASLAARG